AYVHGRGCRRQAMSEYFAATSAIDPCGRCDCCQGSATAIVAATKPRAQTLATPIPPGLADALLDALDALAKPTGRLDLARSLRGSKAKSVTKLGLHRLDFHGGFAEHSQAEVLAALDALTASGKLCPKGKYGKLWVASKTAARKKPSVASPRARAASTRTELTRELENYRRRMARQLACKPYMV